MIPAPLADLLRYVDAVLVLLLVPAAAWSATVGAHTLDQRLRFVALAGMGVILGGAHLDSLGEEATWRLPLLTVLTAVATAGCLIFAVREFRERDER